jgi:hypothetical protein
MFNVKVSCYVMRRGLNENFPGSSLTTGYNLKIYGYFKV